DIPTRSTNVRFRGQSGHHTDGSEMSAFDPKRTFLLTAIRKRSLPVIGSRGDLLPALRTATPPCCAVGGPSPQRHRRVRGRTRTNGQIDQTKGNGRGVNLVTNLLRPIQAASIC